jgi:Fe2+ or Zn2+ uptake regulation protein
VFHTLNKEYKGSLSTGNLDPIVHGRFRGGCYEKNGTLNGAYTRELISVVKKLILVKNGELEIVELVDPEALSLLTHTKNIDNNRIMRKNEKTQLNRASIERIDETDCNMIKSFLINIYGTLYGKISPLLNEAMDLWVKLYRKRVKLVKTNKKPVNPFISDEKGQITLGDNNSLFKAVEYIINSIYALESDIKEIKKSTVQSTLNIPSKAVFKTMDVVVGTVKSHKREAKLDKAKKILKNLMKWNEHGFTVKEYHKSLSKLEKQGDPRTARSDLKMLEANGDIKKARSHSNGDLAYLFTNNDQYHKFNSELAKTKFIAAVKEHFFKDDAFTVNDLNTFIEEKYGLFDARSQNRYLKWLIADGLIRRHPVNSRLLLKE